MILRGKMIIGGKLETYDGYDPYREEWNFAKHRQNKEFMEALGIPVHTSGSYYPEVFAKDLVEIFTDEEKLKNLLSKLKLKAFW